MIIKKREFLILFIFAVFSLFLCPPVNAEKVSIFAEATFDSKCETMIIKEINKSKTELLIAIYSITNDKITRSIVNASKRGVKVSVKYDAKSSEWKDMHDTIKYLKKNDVECFPVKMKGRYAKMHHKFTVIDRNRVLTGSYNYTVSASTVNYENLILLNSPKMARDFIKEFNSIKNK